MFTSRAVFFSPKDLFSLTRAQRVHDPCPFSTIWLDGKYQQHEFTSLPTRGILLKKKGKRKRRKLIRNGVKCIFWGGKLFCPARQEISGGNGWVVGTIEIQIYTPVTNQTSETLICPLKIAHCINYSKPISIGQCWGSGSGCFQSDPDRLFKKIGSVFKKRQDPDTLKKTYSGLIRIRFFLSVGSGPTGPLHPDPVIKEDGSGSTTHTNLARNRPELSVDIFLYKQNILYK